MIWIKESKNLKSKLLGGIRMIVLSTILFGGVTLSMAGGQGSGQRGSIPQSQFAPKFTPTPPVLHPVVPPPEFFKRWSVTEMVKLFQERGLEITNIRPLTEEDRVSLPAEPEEGIRFSIPSFKEDPAGCILGFKDREDLERTRRYYLSLNEKGELYNWTFARDNILVVLDGRLSESVAGEYEKAIKDNLTIDQ